jgi:hypothetical protein
MSNRTYVCIDCQISRRAEASYGLVHDFRCSQCSKPLFELPWRRRIPPKDNKIGWKELAALIVQREKEWIPQRITMGEAKIKKIDRIISACQSKEKQKKLLYERRIIQKQYNIKQDGAC